MGSRPRPFCCRRLEQLHSRALLATLIFTCAATVVVTVTASSSPNRPSLTAEQRATAAFPVAAGTNPTTSANATATASNEAPVSTSSFPRLSSSTKKTLERLENITTTSQLRTSRAARVGDILTGGVSNRCVHTANNSVCQSTGTPVLLRTSTFNFPHSQAAALVSDQCSHAISSTETLRYCGSLSLWSLLNDTVKRGATAVGCASDYLYNFVQELKRLDEEIGRIYRSFSNLVNRFDCQEPYSISYTCQDCKEAYLDWLCSMHVPFYGHHGKRLQPCASICQRVQLMCPYFLPSERFGRSTQFAGEPTFLCQDPVISQSTPFLTASNDCCLHSCCLNSGHTWCSPNTCEIHSECSKTAAPDPGHDTSTSDAPSTTAASETSNRHDNHLNGRRFYYRRLRHWRHHRRKFRHRNWRRHHARRQHHVHHHPNRWHHYRYRRQLQPHPTQLQLISSAGQQLKSEWCVLLFLLLFLLFPLCVECCAASVIICPCRVLCILIVQILCRCFWSIMDLLLQTVMVLLQTFAYISPVLTMPETPLLQMVLYSHNCLHAGIE